MVLFFFSSRRRHTRWNCDWSSDVCSSDLDRPAHPRPARRVAQLARPRGHHQGAPRARLRAHGALARDGLVQPGSRPPGAPAARPDPPVTAAIAVLQADVFTARAFAGNPAVAVLDADGLDEAAMQRIAGELRAPGTAFVS